MLFYGPRELILSSSQKARTILKNDGQMKPKNQKFMALPEQNH